MIPVFETVHAGGVAALGFAKAYRWLLLLAVAIYAVSAAAAVILVAHVHPIGAFRPYLVTWGFSLPATLLLAPYWVALCRFVILGDRARGYLTFDVRVRRMLVVLFALSVIAMFGGAPTAFAFDFNPTLHGRQSIALSVLAVAAIVRVLCFWLAFRLAIAPAMAAAGTRKRPLDTAFHYTVGVVWRLVGVRLIVYLPLLAMQGTLALTGGLSTVLHGAMASQPMVLGVMTLVTAATELVDGACMAGVARRLAGRRPATAEATVAA